MREDDALSTDVFGRPAKMLCTKQMKADGLCAISTFGRAESEILLFPGSAALLI